MQDSKFPFAYIGDQQKFKDFSAKGPLMGIEAAAQRLMTYSNIDKKQAIEQLVSVMQVPVNSSNLKQTQLDWDKVYDDVRSMLPIYTVPSSNGRRQLYYIDEKNQATLIDYQDDDSLIISVMNNPIIWQKLKAYYRNSEMIEPHRYKISLKTFCKRLLNEHLLMDETLFLQQQPRNFSWDTSIIAFKQFDASSVAPGETPTWDEFTNRLNYPEVFMAWVWSLFDPSNNIRQTMWLTGGGNDGKSAVQKALRQIFGAQHVYDCKREDEKQPWFQANVFGKSLVNYADCDNPYLLTNQGIKQLTGGDATSIENKGVAAFSAEIYAKMFVTSNMPPKINPDLEAQTSRLIRLKLAPIAKGAPKDEQFKTRLVQEAWAFLYKCRDQYQNYINNGSDALILPESLTAEIINECAEEDYYITEDFVKKYVEFGPEFHCGLSDLNTTINGFVNMELNYNNEKAKFIRLKFETKLALRGIRLQPIKSNNEEILAFLGFRLKKVFLKDTK